MKTLQVRTAKAEFSAVVAAAKKGRPTLITRHGRPEAMVVPVEQGRRLYERGNFGDFLLRMPGPRLTIKRDKTPLRQIDL